MARTWTGAVAALAVVAALAPAALGATEAPVGPHEADGHDEPDRTDGAALPPQAGELTAPPDEVLIRLDQRVRPEPTLSAHERGQQRRAIDRRQNEVAREIRARGGRVQHAFDTVPLLSATVPEARQDQLAAHDAVDAVMPNWRVERHLDDAVPLIGASTPAVTEAGVTGGSQTVAIIDTGIEYDHAFFAGADGTTRVAAEACFLTGSTDTCPDGTSLQQGRGAADPLAGNWHGLHVAGIAAGSTDSAGAPDRGTAPDADILAANVFDSSGRASTADIIAALEWVYQHSETATGSHDIAAANLSLGTRPLDPVTCDDYFAGAYDDVVANLNAAGTLTVAAAGNSASREFMGAPACLDGIVSVAASADTDRIAGFSNAAPATDLTAPGVNITSATLDGGYGTASGTSMAAPMVAGAAALVADAAPGASADEVLTALQASPVTVDDDRSGGDVAGLPRVDVPTALVERGALALSAASTTRRALPGTELAVDTAALVRGAGAEDLTVTVTSAPAALDVAVDGATLMVTVPPDTTAGTYPVAWTVDDGTTTVEATLAVRVSPWQTRASLPVWRRAERSSIAGRPDAATDADGRVYVAGGEVNVAGQPSTFERSGRVDRYDPSSGAWETVAPLSAPVADVALASDGAGRIYALHSGDVVERFDPEAGEWATLPSLTVARTSLTATAGAGGVYAIGGRDPDSQDTVATVERFDPADGSWETIAPLATPREALAATADAAGRVYAIAGLDWSGSDAQVLDSVERLDAGTWEPVAPLAQGARYAHGAATDADGRPHAVAGWGAAGAERYAPDDQAWTAISGAPRERPRPAVAASGGRVHAVGDLTQRFVNVAPAPGAIAGTMTDAAQQALPDAEVVVTGGTDAVTTTDAAGEYAVDLPPDVYTVTVDHADFHPATVDDVAVISAETTTVDVALEPVIETIAVEPGQAEIGIGDTQQLTATATYADGSDADVTDTATWTSTDPAVATVDGGLATAHDAGTTDLTAELDGHTATATLTVAEPDLAGLAVEPEAEIGIGDTHQLTATATYTDGSEADITDTAAWTSADPAVATVDGGLATAHDAGTTDLTAELDGHTATATLTVAAPTPDPEVVRIAGADRFATAARLSAMTFAPGVDRAYVATGTGFADALAGGVAAARADAPVLLVTAHTVPGATAAELDRLRPREIVVLGGPAAVSDSTADELAGFTDGPVDRVAGAERFATAAQVAQHAFPDGADTVYVGTGLDFPDVLAGVPAAAAADAPMLLAARDTLPAATAAELDRLDPDRIVVLGGESAVSDGVAAALSGWGAVERIAGANRFATASAVAGQLDAPDTVYVATGLGFADALTAGAVAGAEGAPTLLVTSDAIPSATATALGQLAPRRIVVMGGDSAVSAAVASDLRGYLDS